MLILTVSRAGQHVSEFTASEDTPVTVGSSGASTLVLADDALAREHCALSFGDGHWVLTDLAGRGVSLNNVPTTQQAVQDGDIIGLGPFKIVVGIRQDRSSAAPVAAPSEPLRPEPAETSSPRGDADAVQDKTVFRARPTFEGQGPNALEILEGPGQGLVKRFGDTLRIGRSQQCDLIIQHPAISREHAVLRRTREGWEAKSLNERNPLTVNGQSVTSARIKTGDILGIGPARLRPILEAGPPPRRAPLAVPPILKNRKVLIGLGLGVFVLLVLGMLLSGPSDKTKDAVLQETRQKEKVLDQAELDRKVSALLTQARTLADQGDVDQALARYQSVLDMRPGQTDAVNALAELRAKKAEIEAQTRERERQTAALRDKVVGIIVEGDRLLAQGKLKEAAAAAQKALAVSPNDQEARDLLAKANEAMEAARQQAEEKTRQQAESRARLRELYTKADEQSRAGHLYPALKLYRDAAAEDADQARAAEAKAKAARLQDALVKQIMPDYNQGLKFYAQKKYREALACWLKVLAIYPEAKETKVKVAELRPIMEADAKRLYEEGLVYEGLGNRQEAMKRWHAVLDEMPFEDNPYRQKALTKLGR